MRQAWANLFKGPANFFKHGRYDEEGARYEFDPHLSELLLMACCKGISNLGLVIAPQELALAYWQYFTLPEVFRAHKGLMESPKVQYVQQLAAKGREVYFREFMAAADAGMLAPGEIDIRPPNLPESAE